MMECKICLKRLSATSAAVSLPCDESHTFHSECLTHWFVNNRECPVCGQESSSDLMKPLFNSVPVTNTTPSPACVLTTPLNHTQPAARDDGGDCYANFCCCFVKTVNEGFLEHERYNRHVDSCCTIL